MTEENELEELLAALGVTPEWKVENIKDVAMNRFNVRKSKRPHIKKILDQAFELLRQEYNYNKKVNINVHQTNSSDRQRLD